MIASEPTWPGMCTLSSGNWKKYCRVIKLICWISITYSRDQLKACTSTRSFPWNRLFLHLTLPSLLPGSSLPAPRDLLERGLIPSSSLAYFTSDHIRPNITKTNPKTVGPIWSDVKYDGLGGTGLGACTQFCTPASTKPEAWLLTDFTKGAGGVDSDFTECSGNTTFPQEPSTRLLRTVDVI